MNAQIQGHQALKDQSAKDGQLHPLVRRIGLRVKLAFYWLDNAAANYASALRMETFDKYTTRRIWEIERSNRVRSKLNSPNTSTTSLVGVADPMHY